MGKFYHAFEDGTTIQGDSGVIIKPCCGDKTYMYSAIELLIAKANKHCGSYLYLTSDALEARHALGVAAALNPQGSVSKINNETILPNGSTIQVASPNDLGKAPRVNFTFVVLTEDDNRASLSEAMAVAINGKSFPVDSSIRDVIQIEINSAIGRLKQDNK